MPTSHPTSTQYHHINITSHHVSHNSSKCRAPSGLGTRLSVLHVVLFYHIVPMLETSLQLHYTRFPPWVTYWPAAPHGSVASAATVCAVYVDMGLSSNNPVVLTVVTAGTSFSRTFSVKITQIECDTLAKGDNRYFKHIKYDYYIQRVTGVCSTTRAWRAPSSPSTTTTARGSSSPTRTTPCVCAWRGTSAVQCIAH